MDLSYPQKKVKIESSTEFEKILSNYVLTDTPYFGVQESQYNYVNQNFSKGQAVLILSPPDDLTGIEPEDNNIELITKDVIYSMSGVSEKQYDEWYQEYKEDEFDDNNESHKTLKYIKLFEEFTSEKMKEIDYSNLYVEYCDKCIQMTNHLNGKCQKCKRKKEKKNK
jgi:hypothetical protein